MYLFDTPAASLMHYQSQFCNVIIYYNIVHYNDIELQINQLNILYTMYNQIYQSYDYDTFRNRLNEIEFLSIRLKQRMEFLNSDSSFAIRNFVQKKKTGGRPKTLINEGAIKL